MQQLSAKESILKLIVNATYGVLASQLFKTGNSILANNITARARLWVWLISRPLNGYQCITDGFAYSPQNVLAFRDLADEKTSESSDILRKPGLETLSSLIMLEMHKSIKTVPMGDIDWGALYAKKEPSYKDFSNVDTLAQEHIKKFWEHYNLHNPYELEHKMEHTALRLYYLKRAHYGLLPLIPASIKEKDQIIWKFRGIPFIDKENFVHYKIIANVLLNKKFFIDTLEQYENRLIRISDYLQSKKKNIKETKKGEDLVASEIKIPGYSEKRMTLFRMNNQDITPIDIKYFNNLISQDKDYAEDFLKTEKPEEILWDRIKTVAEEKRDYSARTKLNEKEYLTVLKEIEKRRKKKEKKNKKRSKNGNRGGHPLTSIKNR